LLHDTFEVNELPADTMVLELEIASAKPKAAMIRVIMMMLSLNSAVGDLLTVPTSVVQVGLRGGEVPVLNDCS